MSKLTPIVVAVYDAGSEMKQCCPECGKVLRKGRMIGIVRFADGSRYALPTQKFVTCCGEKRQTIAMFDSKSMLQEAGVHFLEHMNEYESLLPLPPEIERVVTDDLPKVPKPN